MSIVDIYIMPRAITLHKLMKMQITHKKHFWRFLWLVFEINHTCSNSFVFTIRKNKIVLIVDIKRLYLQKNANFLISALKSSEKGVGVIYQLYNFI